MARKQETKTTTKKKTPAKRTTKKAVAEVKAPEVTVEEPKAEAVEEVKEEPKAEAVEEVKEEPKAEAAEEVICYPYVKDDKELFKIIAGSRIFLFLSLIEGFGFPPLEAMQLQVPVICSDRTSLPEVISDAAVSVDPKNPEEVADRMEQLICDDRLCEELVMKGTENYKRFDWNRIVSQYMEELTG